MKGRNFSSYNHCKTFCEIFPLLTYKETENASTEYNASDADLLLSCHILKWCWTSSSFRCRSEKQASRWLRKKKSKVRPPFKFVVFVSGEDSALMKDFYCFDHATSWCLNCPSTEDPVLAMARRVFLPLTPPRWDSNVDYIFLIKTKSYSAFLKSWFTTPFAEKEKLF